MAVKKINLALQGGGSHGAYTWGVLDRLIEEDDIEIEAISGTSAGAINAAVFADGWQKNGREGAKKALYDLWHTIHQLGVFSPFNKSPAERFLTGWNLDMSPAYIWMDMLSRIWSPYMLNPTNYNPLLTILQETIDFKAIKKSSAIQLFITATHVESGQARVFTCPELSPNVLMASACLPQVFQAVEIEGEYYWDGGYMGNPALWPLLYHTQSQDIMLIQINPLFRESLPTTAMEITNRLNEITFNSSLVAEMRAIDFVKRLHEENKLDKDKYKNPYIHMVHSPKRIDEMNASSKMNVSMEFLDHLHSIGRSAADRWLGAHLKDIGKRTTIDIRGMFLCGANIEKQKAEKEAALKQEEQQQ